MLGFPRQPEGTPLPTGQTLLLFHSPPSWPSIQTDAEILR